MDYILYSKDYSMDRQVKRSSGDAAPLECRGRFVHGLLEGAATFHSEQQGGQHV